MTSNVVEMETHSQLSAAPNTTCGICHAAYFDESGCDPCPKCSASFGSQVYPVCHACGALIKGELTPMKCDDGQTRPFHDPCALEIDAAEFHYGSSTLGDNEIVRNAAIKTLPDRLRRSACCDAPVYREGSEGFRCGECNCVCNVRGWQPIETCPKDGTCFLACSEASSVFWAHWANGVVDGTDYNGDDGGYRERHASYWMPVPLPVGFTREGEMMRR